MAKRASTRLGWQALATGIDARKRERSAVRAYAHTLGIKPARQQAPKPKRAKRQRTADQQHGPARSLSAAEIRALGFPTSKPEEPARSGSYSVMYWRRGRKLSPEW